MEKVLEGEAVGAVEDKDVVMDKVSTTIIKSSEEKSKDKSKVKCYNCKKKRPLSF